jgi:hypothetical protein
MSDAYYPADGIEILAGSDIVRQERAAHARESSPKGRATIAEAQRRRDLTPMSPEESLAYRGACAANGVKFTEHDGSDADRTRVRARHCVQARAGYFYCTSTSNDPCGYRPGNPHPHDNCTAANCVAC